MRVAMVALTLVLILPLAAPGSAEERGRINSPARIAVGQKVPDFVVPDLRGRGQRLSRLLKQSKSGVVVLTFWCTICSTCRTMEDRLEQLHRSGGRQVGVYALDANTAGETPRQIVAFMKRKRLSFPVLMDVGGRLAQAFGVRATTTTLVIDSKRILRYFGKFDDRRGREAYTVDAVKALLENRPVAIKQTRPVG